LEYRIGDNVQTYRPGDLDNKNDVNHDQEYNHYYHEHDSGDKTVDLCQNLEIDNLTCQYEEEIKLCDKVIYFEDEVLHLINVCQLFYCYPLIKKNYITGVPYLLNVFEGQHLG
jgi:hypothetical protein